VGPKGYSETVGATGDQGVWHEIFTMLETPSDFSEAFGRKEVHQVAVSPLHCGGAQGL
jgi:hypothetical protein